MSDEQLKRIREMRDMPDEDLVRFYEVVAIGCHEARKTADFKRYDIDRPVLLYTREEIVRRMKERNRRPAGRF